MQLKHIQYAFELFWFTMILFILNIIWNIIYESFKLDAWNKPTKTLLAKTHICIIGLKTF